MNITLNKLSKGHFFCMVALGVSLIMSAPSHASDCKNPAGLEGDVRYDTTTKNFYFCNASAWEFFGGATPPAYDRPSDVRLTISARTGDFYQSPEAQSGGAVNGYHAIQIWAENNGCAGYKVCSSGDLIAYLAAGNELPDPGGSGAYAWVNSDGGADAGLGGNNTCIGSNIAWNIATSSSYARAFYSRHDVAPKSFFEYWRACNISQRVWCCKY